MSLAVALLSLAVVAGGERTTVVSRLYAYVVAAQPLGIPPPSDDRVLESLLSRRLLAVLKAGRACQADYLRKHRSDGKPEFGWLELGLFSGANERATPAEYRILKTDESPNGPARVTVALTYRESPDTYCCRPPDPKSSRSWHVVVLVKTEEGHQVVGDVIHLDSPNWRLSEAFNGCRGSEWVGSTP
ncbi:MAG: hypothetical protein U0599_02340 [Vicinamibacteria bacterium]